MLRQYFKNINYKFTDSFWNEFAKKEHYFKGSILLEELKSSEYMNILRNIDLSDILILKTDLYVEAKNRKDNFLPHLTINRCIGIDISLEIVRMARNNLRTRFPRMKFVVADVRRLPFKDTKFGFILSDAMLNHIPKEDLGGALAEIKRIAAKKSFILVSLNNIFNLFFLERNIKNLFFKGHYFNWAFDPRYIYRLISHYKFKITLLNYIFPLEYFGLYLICLSKRIKKLEFFTKKYLSFFSQIKNLPFFKNIFCLQFIILAEALE